MSPCCAACRSLVGQGRNASPHPRLQLVQRKRCATHDGARITALFFECAVCDCELRCDTSPDNPRAGWSLSLEPSGMSKLVSRLARGAGQPSATHTPVARAAGLPARA